MQHIKDIIYKANALQDQLNVIENILSIFEKMEGYEGMSLRYKKRTDLFRLVNSITPEDDSEENDIAIKIKQLIINHISQLHEEKRIELESLFNLKVSV